MYSYSPIHMAGQKQDDHLEHTFSSYVRIRDVALKTYQRQWTIGRSGEKGSGISILVARYDDDEDDFTCMIEHFKKTQWIYMYWNKHMKLVSRFSPFENFLILICKIKFAVISFYNNMVWILSDKIWSEFEQRWNIVSKISNNWRDKVNNYWLMDIKIPSISFANSIYICIYTYTLLQLNSLLKIRVTFGILLKFVDKSFTWRLIVNTNIWKNLVDISEVIWCM